MPAARGKALRERGRRAIRIGGTRRPVVHRDPRTRRERLLDKVAARPVGANRDILPAETRERNVEGRVASRYQRNRLDEPATSEDPGPVDVTNDLPGNFIGVGRGWR